MIKYCEKCAITKENMKAATSEKIADFGAGYLIGYGDKIERCPYCNNNLIDIPISDDDFLCIRDISDCNKILLDAMIKLYDENIIDYQLKMSQFRTYVEQQKQVKEAEENQIRCPKCGSTNVTTGQRGFKLTTGFLGSGKTVNRCGNCGYSWKPKNIY